MTDSTPNPARVRELFDRAAEMGPEERTAFLRDACGDDEELLRDVVSLLSHAGPDEAFADIVGRAAAEVPSDEPSRVGTHIGPYTVIERIGHGGMGTVWLAERSDEAFSKKVALKIVRGGLDAPQLLQRFRAERRILARLEHPGIARILDGGQTDDGLPYFVLEYVDGIRIDDYCRRHHLDTRARLRLFARVCEAVAYAHRNLVIHRDLKPANILVAEGETPKLLDFGIAKLTSDDLEHDVTLMGSRPMTPDYAAPEQIRGEPVTTATDVYALGLLLFELLTGSHPFRRPASSLRDLEAAVLDTDPALPSQSVEAPHADGDAASLRRELRGDLDNIILKAIEKDPARRYTSVVALAEDVARHLEGRPVQARPSTVTYRMGKFIGRHAMGVTTAAGVAVLLISATIVSAIGFLRAERARSEAEVQRDTVEEINTFLRGMFTAASPVETQSKENLTVRQVLDAAAERIGKDLADRPEVAASLHHAIGRSYLDLGLWNPAEEALRSAIAARREIGGLATPEGIDALTDLGVVLGKEERYDEASGVLLEAVRLARSAESESIRSNAKPRRKLAEVRGLQGRYDEADSMYRAMLSDFEVDSGEDQVESAATAADYGVLLISRGRYADAEQNLRNALEGFRAVYGEDHSDVARTWANLAYCLNNLEQPAEAKECAERALAIHERVFPEGHVQIANARVHRAEALGRLGRLDEADLEFSRVLDTYRETYGPQSGVVAITINNIALMYWQDAKEYERALPLLREAASLFAHVYGPEHPYTATGRHNVASLLEALGRLDAAESECRAALELRRKVVDSDHTDIARSEILLGRLLITRGAAEESEPLLRDAIRISALNLPDDHPLRSGAELQLGRCLAALRQTDEAERYLRSAHERFLSALGPEGDMTRIAAAELAKLYEGAN